MDPTLPTFDFRDFWSCCRPSCSSAWGLVVLLADLVLARRQSRAARRTTIGWLALSGRGPGAGRPRSALLQVQQRRAEWISAWPG